MKQKSILTALKQSTFPIKKEIKNLPENWEDGPLGKDEKYTAIADISLQHEIDKSFTSKISQLKR